MVCTYGVVGVMALEEFQIYLPSNSRRFFVEDVFVANIEKKTDLPSAPYIVALEMKSRPIVDQRSGPAITAIADICRNNRAMRWTWAACRRWMMESQIGRSAGMALVRTPYCVGQRGTLDLFSTVEDLCLSSIS